MSRRYDNYESEKEMHYFDPVDTSINELSKKGIQID